MQKKLFTVTGMTCHSCKKMIEMTAEDFPQIKKCDVDFRTGKGTMEYENGFDPEQFRKEINSLGQYSLQFND